jgi:hypothetical protein
LLSGESTGQTLWGGLKLGFPTRRGAIRLEHVAADLRRFMLMRIIRARSPSSD